MINNFNKNLPLVNKFLKFVFFIRYLLLLFVFSTLLFLILPKLFNYEKDVKFIENQLKDVYKIKLESFESINYKIFPSPRLILNNSKLSIDKIPFNLFSEKLVIKLDLKDIYQIKNIKLNKIFLEKSTSEVQIRNIKSLISYFELKQKKLNFRNSVLLIKDKTNVLLKLNEFNFSSLNIKRIKLNAKYINKKIDINFERNINLNKFDLKIKDLGIKSSIFFLKGSNLDISEGKAEIKILNNNLKFDFKKNEILLIEKSNFRNKNLVSSFNGSINFEPFLEIDLEMNLKKIKVSEFLSNALFLILNENDYAKKINGKIAFIHEPKQTFKNLLIKKGKLNTSLQNGKLIFEKSKFFLHGAELELQGNISEFKGNKRLYFNLLLNIKDKNKFSKFLSLSKNKIENKKVEILGSYNFISNKINFEKIKTDDHEYNKEELIFIKNNFEIIADKDLMNFFSTQSIKKFILNII